MGAQFFGKRGGYGLLALHLAYKQLHKRGCCLPATQSNPGFGQGLNFQVWQVFLQQVTQGNLILVCVQQALLPLGRNDQRKRRLQRKVAPIWADKTPKALRISA